LQYLIQSRSSGPQNPFDVPIGVNRLRLDVTAEHLPLRVKRRDARQVKDIPEAHAIGETELLIRQHIRRSNDMFHGGASQQQTMGAGMGRKRQSLPSFGAAAAEMPEPICLQLSPGVADCHHRH
jgi:hypothetical protein